jgi:hypothetical protein
MHGCHKQFYWQASNLTNNQRYFLTRIERSTCYRLSTLQFVHWPKFSLIIYPALKSNLHALHLLLSGFLQTIQQLLSRSILVDIYNGLICNISNTILCYQREPKKSCSKLEDQPNLLWYSIPSICYL